VRKEQKIAIGRMAARKLEAQRLFCGYDTAISPSQFFSVTS